MTASGLAKSLRDAGLVVEEFSGWKTRGRSWQNKLLGKPIGVMMHHTAPPVPYPVARLAGTSDGLVRCNVNTKPDGTVWMVAYKACNYSSGPGLSDVLNEVKAGVSPTANAKDRGYTRADDDTNGNPYFVNFENDHLGDGSPMPSVQHEAIVTATQVVLDHYGLHAGNVISHGEWTARKRDPYWDNNRRAIETIREGLGMTPEQEAKLDAVLVAVGKVPDEIFFKQITSAGYTRTLLQSWLRTEDNVAKLRAADLATGDDIDAAVDELIDLLPSEVLDLLYQRLAPGPR